MRVLNSASLVALAIGNLGWAGTALAAEAAPTGGGEQLETIVVTANKREENVQNAPLSITALSGATIEKNKILSLADLASSITGVSFTANSPQANEINIRGVVNNKAKRANRRPVGFDLCRRCLCQPFGQPQLRLLRSGTHRSAARSAGRAARQERRRRRHQRHFGGPAVRPFGSCHADLWQLQS